MAKIKDKKLLRGIFLAVIISAAYLAGLYIGKTGAPKSGMSDDTCKSVESQIRSMSSAAPGDRINALNNLWRQNCSGKKIENKSAPAEIDERPLPEKTCAAIEALLTESINGFYPWSQNAYDYFDKARIYATLVKDGCRENRDKYKTLAIREIDIGRALDPHADLTELNHILHSITPSPSTTTHRPEFIPTAAAASL